MYGRKQTPFEVGFQAGQKAKGLPGRVEFIGSDSAMWAVTDGGPSIAEEFQRGLTAAAGGAEEHTIPLVSAPKGPGSRATRLQLAHEYLRYTPIPKGTKLPGGLVSDGTLVPPWAGPPLPVPPGL
jgi:hypothetical protein